MDNITKQFMGLKQNLEDNSTDTDNRFCALASTITEWSKKASNFKHKLKLNSEKEKNTMDIVDTLKHQIPNLEERMSLWYEEPTALYDSEDEDQAYGHHHWMSDWAHLYRLFLIQSKLKMPCEW